MRHHKRTNRGSAIVPIAVTLGLFVLVLGTAVWFASGSSPDDSASAISEDRPTAGDMQPQARNEDTGRDGLSVPQADGSGPEADGSGPEDGSQVFAAVANSARQPDQQDTDASSPDAAPDVADVATTAGRLEEVKALLAAGEFVAALDIVQKTTDPQERSQLLRLVADAQMEAGDFDSALSSIRRIPLPEERSKARGERASRQSFAGGGSMADFTQLIDLIQNETSGPWLEIDSDGGTISEFDTGVRVDPNGMLFRLTQEEDTGRLEQLRLQVRQADLNEDMARRSSLRLVSLTRLEREIERRQDNGQPLLQTMKYLAGLSRVQYLFVFPENGEIVIGGPAEGWEYNERGMPVGIDSGQPILQLDDLVTVMRTFSPDGRGIFQCLIVPRQEGLKKAKQFAALSQSRGPLRPGAGVRNFVNALQDRLGLQDIVVNGVPQDSRVARVIVEADYRMKLIGVDKLDAGPNFPSYFDLLPKQLQQNPPATTALRWWLTMKYDAVMHSADRDVFEIQGSSVLCQSENEIIRADGTRIHTGQSDPTNRLFAQKFTEHYAELAERDLIFADLQNIFDLSLVAALIQHERLDDRTGWDRGVFADQTAYRPAEFPAPTTVMSVVNHRVYNGRNIVVQVAGGVRGDLMAVVKNQQVVRESPRLDNFANQGRAPQLPEGRWWWDAAE